MFRLLVALVIACCSIDSLHAGQLAGKTRAECLVWWQIENIGCDVARESIEAKILEWNEAICHEDPDETCWYPKLLESNKEDMIETTHITQLVGPMGPIEDNIWIHFSGYNNGASCRVMGLSRSPVGFKWDYGTNYCNMYNLMEGAGLTHEAAGFREITSKNICTGYDMPDLKVKHCPQRNCCLEQYTGRRHGQPGEDLNVPSAAPKIDPRK